MRFEVIGTGSIGLLLAARLQQAHFSVQLWTRTNETAALINEQGITLYELDGGHESKLFLPCSTIGQYSSVEQSVSTEETYAIVAVKQTHINETFIEQVNKLSALRGYQAIIAIQNGVGHIDSLAKALECPIITAVTSEGAKRAKKNEVIHTGKGNTALGEELGRDKGQIFQKKLMNALQLAGFSAFVSKNIKEQVYRKLIINSVINPLTALFDIANGELPQSELRLMLMKQLFEETKSILLAEERTLQSCQLDEVIQVCHATAGNTSSMRSDVLRKEMTEIACINGAVVRIAARSNKKAPLNESIVHIIEALHPER